MKELATIMKAMSDPNRLTILKLLQDGPLCVCQLHGALDLAQPTVSRHLKVLENAGLIQGRRERNWVHYSLVQDPGGQYVNSLLASLASWLEDDAQVSGARRRVREGCKAPLVDELGELEIPAAAAADEQGVES